MLLSMVTFTIICSVLILFAVIQFLGRHRPRIVTLSGPKGWPVFGSAFDIGRITPPHQTIAKWAAEFGPTFTVRMPNADWYVACDYKSIHEILVTTAYETGSRPTGYRNQTASRGLRGILSSKINSPWWLPQRKAFHRSTRLYGDGLTRMEGIFSEITEDLMTKFASYNQAAVDIRDDLYDFSAKVLFIVMIGRKPAAGDQRYEKCKAIERSLVLALGPNNVQGALLDAFPILRFFGNSAHKLVTSATEICDKLWEELWSEVGDNYATDNSECLIHSLAQLMDKESKHYDPSVSLDNMKAVLIDIVMAALSTTTSSAYALFNILLHYPRVEEKLHEEVDCVVGRSRRPNLSDREKMPYTTAVIYELLRYTSIVPQLGHVAGQDVKLSGHKVFAGTVCACSLWVLHHDDKIWSDPWVFRPERFIDEDGHLLPAEHPNRKNLLAFGAGPRVCLGELFALRRLFYIVTHAMQNFTLRPADVTCMPSCDPRNYQFGLVLTPNRFLVKLEERNLF